MVQPDLDLHPNRLSHIHHSTVSILTFSKLNDHKVLLHLYNSKYFPNIFGVARSMYPGIR